MLRPLFATEDGGKHVTTSVALIRRLISLSKSKARIIAMRRWFGVLNAMSKQRDVEEYIPVLKAQMTDEQLDALSRRILRACQSTRESPKQAGDSPFNILLDVVRSCEPTLHLPTYAADTVCAVCRQSRFISLTFRQLRRPDEPMMITYVCSNHAEPVTWKR